MSWERDNEWERYWWGNCSNTYGEEMKQLLYANRMGLKTFHDGKSPFNFDMQGQSIVDIGGGPVSLLLKCCGLSRGVVVDPCDYPDWVAKRYMQANIQVIKEKAEAWEPDAVYDEAWVYNVLQHTEAPSQVLLTASRAARLLRVFEWIDTDVTLGHPHAFTAEMLDTWLGGQGKIEGLTGEATCVGTCYYGIFKGNHYEAV
jgi:hypothetical protein